VKYDSLIIFIILLSCFNFCFSYGVDVLVVVVAAATVSFQRIVPLHIIEKTLFSFTAIFLPIAKQLVKLLIKNISFQKI